MRSAFGKECFLSILFELCFVLFIAAAAPLIIRYCLLPSSVHHQYPLNIVFHTCDHDLHSVCSFPSATLDYEKNSLFSPNVAYYLNVRLKFADIANTNKLGLFQNVITISDENLKVLRRYTKTAYVKEAGMVMKAFQVFFFPLYFLGFFYDYNTLTIPMSAEYLEREGTCSTRLVFTVQDKFANIEEAELVVTARFGLIRHLLYYWPTTSYTILFVFIFLLGVFLIVVKLGYQEYSARANALIEKDKTEIFKNGGETRDLMKSVVTEDVKKETAESIDIRKRK